MTKCKKCTRTLNDQICGFNNDGVLIYIDVGEAIKFLKKNPRKHEKFLKKDFTRNRLKHIVRLQNDPHLQHINTRFIGIVGQTDTDMFIIDGNHRAAKKFINNGRFRAYKLTVFETGLLSITKPPDGHKFVYD